MVAILPIDNDCVSPEVTTHSSNHDAEVMPERSASKRTPREEAEELSRKLMRKFEAPESPEFKWPSCPRNLCELADSSGLSVVVFACVIVNGIQMGVQADHDVEKDLWFLDHLFTGVFAAEMFIKVAAWRREYFRSNWNAFDFTLTWLSIIDVWIMAALGGGSGMKMFSVLRILRVFRIMRLLRMVKCLRDLTLVVNGFVSAMKTSFWVSLLLVLLLYIFAIFCSSTVGKPGIYPGHDEDEVPEVAENFNSYQYFGTIPRAMFTLLNVALVGSDWVTVARATLEKQPFILILLLFWVMITSIGLMNVIAGIVVDHVISSAHCLQKDEDQNRSKEMLARLHKLYTFVFDLDLDGSGSLDAEELTIAWDRDEMQDLLAIVHLPIGSEAQDLLDLIDANGDGELEMAEFVKSLVRLLTNDMFQHLLEAKSCLNRILREVKEMRAEGSAPSQQLDITKMMKDITQEEVPQEFPEDKVQIKQVRLMQQLQCQQIQSLQVSQDKLSADMQEVKQLLRALSGKPSAEPEIIEVSPGTSVAQQKFSTNAAPEKPLSAANGPSGTSAAPGNSSSAAPLPPPNPPAAAKEPHAAPTHNSSLTSDAHGLQGGSLRFSSRLPACIDLS